MKAGMRGRITEAQLPEAEEEFPGICKMYEELEPKPATFLQLVWIYESRRTTPACGAGGSRS